jgi:hypothetical protein
MADDKTKRGRDDRIRINVREDYELWYWTRKLHVSEQVLRDAVRRVGPTVRAVKAFLKQGS